jgi:CubicO group peptidase (beta-lactamase class C family)
MPLSTAARRRVALTLCTGVLVSSSPRQTLTAGTTASTPADSMSQRWVRAVDELHVPGMVVVVVDRERTVRSEMLGWRDVERRLPFDENTRFYIASCTKPFVACAAALLECEGKLDLDAPVRGYLPRFTLAAAGYADSVTVRDLLGHRPGLVNPAITFNDAYTGEITEDRYYRLLARVAPKRSFEYSNLHYTLAGRVIEAVTGKSWKDVLRERIFRPAGMTRTTCSASEFWKDDNIARPYVYQQGRYLPAEPRKVDATMHAAGGIYTTGHDLARWLRLQLGDGVLDGRRVLPASALRTMRGLLSPEAAEPHPLVKSEQRIAMGAGWDIRTLRADTLYCHNGTFPGSGAFLSFLPARNLGVAVATNASGVAVFLAEAVAAEAYDDALGQPNPDVLPVLRKIAERRAKADAPPPATGSLSLAASAYRGEFYHEDFGTLQVTFHADSLAGRIGVLPLPMVLTGTDRFIADGYVGRFEIDAKGAVGAVWLQVAEPDSVRFERRR